MKNGNRQTGRVSVTLPDRKEMCIDNEKRVPLWHKYSLTIREASEYFNLGEKKLRQIIQEQPQEDFILNNGTKVLIKRVKFEQFMDAASCV